MQPQIETLVDLYPTMQLAAHYWLNGQADDNTLVIGRFVYGLYTHHVDTSDSEFVPKHWVRQIRQGRRLRPYDERRCGLTRYVVPPRACR